MPKFYTIPELAESTKMSISYWWKLVKRGDIGVTRIGRCVRVSQQSLDEFLSKQKAA
jgi:excisionase family DNA binding protein